MADIMIESNDDWKENLRSAVVAGLTGNSAEQNIALTQIGIYYMCYAPTFLYKYYGDSLAKLQTIRDNKMWYSAPCKFNDVFDCEITVDEKGIFDSLLHALPGNIQVKTGSPMWRDMKKKGGQQIRSLKSTLDELRSRMGISCLSENDDSLLMWAHYANNHCGMCVEYELIEINKQLKFTPVPIIYSDNRTRIASVKPNNTEKDILRVFLEGLTSKSPEWIYEKEWRIIRDDGACGEKWDTEKKGALLEMIRPSSIILGCMAKPEFEQAVREYCEESKINLYKMEKDAELYRLNKVPVLQFEDGE